MTHCIISSPIQKSHCYLQPRVFTFATPNKKTHILCIYQIQGDNMLWPKDGWPQYLLQTSEFQQSVKITHCHSPACIPVLAHQIAAEWGSGTLRWACSWALPKSAMCVQNFDDSRGPAIRITYHISLRSSSLWDPRHPLLKVVIDLTAYSKLFTREQRVFHVLFWFRFRFILYWGWHLLPQPPALSHRWSQPLAPVFC